jgi:hypothetical protein
MSSRLEELAARRRDLVVQSGRLRAELSRTTPAFEQVLGIADLGVAAGRYVRDRPLLLWLGIAGAVLLVKPRRAVRGISFALSAISIFGQLRRLLSPRR